MKNDSAFPWTEYPLPSSTAAAWDFGPLRLWAKSLHNEIWLAYRYFDWDTDKSPPPNEPPEDLSWSRWVLKESYPTIRFQPRFPDHPVVVKPEVPFLLTSEAQAKIYVRCPLWVHIELYSRSVLEIDEVPTVILSHTWFGTFTEGDLCYWLTSSARREAVADARRPFLHSGGLPGRGTGHPAARPGLLGRHGLRPGLKFLSFS